MVYCLLTLFFGSMSLFLPETRTFPLPRSILQIEAMNTSIGKKLRSRKVKMACERRQTEQQALQDSHRDYAYKQERSNSNLESSKLDSNNNNQYAKNGNNKPFSSTSGSDHPKVVITSPSDAGSRANDSSYNGSHPVGQGAKSSVYDTVTSVHDIEQDDHIYYGKEMAENSAQVPLLPLERLDRKLTKIVEVPSKNITRNNSISDLN